MKLWLGRVALLLLLAGTFQPHYWRMFVIDREAMRHWTTESPYSKMPGLRPFMVAVREATREGEAVAVWLPRSDWYAYSYGFFRSTYLLAGRRAVPLSSTRGPRPENLRFAQYVAAWNGEPEIPGFEPVVRHEHGVLLRRVR